MSWRTGSTPPRPPAGRSTRCRVCCCSRRYGSQEVCGIDIDDLAEERWHHTVTIHGMGDRDATVPLAPRTRAAVEQAVDGRSANPLLRNRWGNRMTRNNVAAAVASLAREAGIARRMTPHTLRHAAITAALNAGAHLRDAQDFARHADPKTTMRYDRNRHSLDRHAHLRHRPVHRRIRVATPGVVAARKRDGQLGGLTEGRREDAQ
jgi:site-specific recombinase XerD